MPEPVNDDAAHQTREAQDAACAGKEVPDLENIAAFGAAIKGTPIVAASKDVWGALLAMAQPSGAQTTQTAFNNLLNQLIESAEPIPEEKSAYGPTYESTVRDLRVRIDPFYSAVNYKLYYRLITA
ncbi:hypothetical protein ACAG26_06745 [Mycobacterium sp. pUA109]|uniref:hypothetical protein n=1 Tax=Mycobacterium sp. pUA109 TaxID=3238982 RepID=UPI00351B3E53